MSTTTLRLKAQITDAAGVQQVERLQAILDTGNADLIRNALQLLDWCVGQVRLGRQIASVNESGTARELAMPILERARAHGRLVMSAQAFEQVTDLIDNPPAPAKALRALMAGKAKARA